MANRTGEAPVLSNTHYGSLSARVKGLAPDLVLVTVFLVLFQRHLTPSTLFWDEWMYVREIQETGSAWQWVVAPSTAHVFIPGKLLFAAIYKFFGYDGMPYKMASLLLHGLTALVLRVLVGRLTSKTVAYLVMSLFLFTTAYEEIIAWPAHYREQFFILFMYSWLAFSHMVFSHENSPSNQVVISCLGAGAFALMSISYANAFFSLIFLLIFALVFHDHLRRNANYTILLAIVAAFSIALHFAWFAGPLKTQTEQQSAEIFTVTAARLAESVMSAGRFTYEGVLAPLVKLGAWPVVTAAFVFILLLLVGGGLVRRLRAERRGLEFRFGLFLGAAFFALIFLQVWYRRDVAFQLNWTKYSYFPIALLLPILAISASGHNRRVGPVCLTALVGLALFGQISKDRRDYMGVSRDARVMELIGRFNRVFSTPPHAVLALPDLRFPWNIFIPDQAPTLSTLWRASPLTRGTPMGFFDPNTAQGSERLAALMAALPSDSKVGEFVVAYFPKNDRPSAGDGGLSKQLAGKVVLVQELLIEEEHGFLTEVALVAGTGGGATGARIAVEILDEQLDPLFGTEIEGAALNNNVATPVSTGFLPVLGGRYFLVVRPARGNGEPPVVLYQTREKHPHLGVSYECNLDVDQPVTALCLVSQNRREAPLGIGFTTSPASALK